jgi:ribonuclease BN (tRNA processing enzyme)
MVQVQFVGSGDAFGSGGRFQTCILIQGAGAPVLIDCGATSLIAMKRLGVEPSEISAIVLTHLHGDHFAGIPFVILDGQFRRRTEPLIIAGPRGTRERVEAAMEILYSGSSKIRRRFRVDFVELVEGQRVAAGAAFATGFEVKHPSGAPPFAVRIEYEGKVVAYSGDTEWTDSLIKAADNSDLFIAEAYTFDKPVKFHLDYRTLEAHRAEFACKRMVLTHLGENLLRHRGEIGVECASDGMIIALE